MKLSNDLPFRHTSDAVKSVIRTLQRHQQVLAAQGPQTYHVCWHMH